MKKKINKVYRSIRSKRVMSLGELKREAGDWFELDRITGKHCDCEEGTGEFILLPANEPVVVEGGKSYMTCRKCGGMSHL